MELADETLAELVEGEMEKGFVEEGSGEVLLGIFDHFLDFLGVDFPCSGFNAFFFLLLGDDAEEQLVRGRRAERSAR